MFNWLKSNSKPQITRVVNKKVYVRSNKPIYNLEDAVSISICISAYSPDPYGNSKLSEPAISVRQYLYLSDNLKDYFEPKIIQITETVI